MNSNFNRNIITLIISSIAFCFFSETQAQKIRYSFKPATKVVKRFIPSSVFLTDDGFTVYGNYSNKGIGSGGVVKYDDELGYLGKEVFKNIYRDRRISYIGMQSIGREKLIFFTFFNAKKKKKYLFFRTYDVENNTLNDDPYMLTSITARNDVYDQIRIKFETSKDGQNLMLLIFKDYYKKRKGRLLPIKTLHEGKTPQMFILNSKLEVVNYRKRMRLKGDGDKIPSGTYNLRSFLLDQDNNLVILGEMKKKKKTSKGKSSRSEDESQASKSITAFFVFTSKGENYSSPISQTDNQTITSIQMANQKDAIVVVGTYASTNYAVNYGINHGVFVGQMEFNADSGKVEILETEFKEFTPEYITKFNGKEYVPKRKKKKRKSKKKRKKRKPGIKAMVMDVVFENDRIIVLLEHQYLSIVTTTSRDPRTGATTTSTSYHYYYNNIGGLVFNKSLEIENDFVIDKTTKSINLEREKGFVQTYHNKVLYIVYPGHISGYSLSRDVLKTNKVKQLKKSIYVRDMFADKNRVYIYGRLSKSYRSGVKQARRPRLNLITLG